MPLHFTSIISSFPSPHELIFKTGTRYSVCCRPAWVGMFSTTWGSSTLNSLKPARRPKQIEDILLSLRILVPVQLGIIYSIWIMLQLQALCNYIYRLFIVSCSVRLALKYISAVSGVLLNILYNNYNFFPPEVSEYLLIYFLLRVKVLCDGNI